MYYLKGTFEQGFDPQTKVQYCEVGDDLYVKRCVEEFWDGTVGFASEEKPDGVGGTFLPEGEFPEKNQIWSSEGEFRSELISAEEFAEVWSKAIATSE